nr:MAG TPA: hypothetical protein [Caudoviricetes sp.]
MSLYTKQEKVKSLWHPITDEDFDIDFSKPFIVCGDDASLFIVEDLPNMFYYLDEDRFYDVKAQALSEEGKEAFREFYVGYMYLDDEFYQAIEWAEGKYLEDVKRSLESIRINIISMPIAPSTTFGWMKNIASRVWHVF